MVVLLVLRTKSMKLLLTVADVSLLFDVASLYYAYMRLRICRGLNLPARSGHLPSESQHACLCLRLINVLVTMASFA